MLYAGGDWRRRLPCRQSRTGPLQVEVCHPVERRSQRRYQPPPATISESALVQIGISVAEHVGIRGVPSNHTGEHGFHDRPLNQTHAVL